MAFTTLVGLYENWAAVGSAAWWTAVAGGAVLAALHGVTRHAGLVLGVLGMALLLIAIVQPSLFADYDRSLFNGLACGFVAGQGERLSRQPLAPVCRRRA